MVLCRAVIAIQKQRASWHRSLYIRNSDLYLQSCHLHPKRVTVTFMLRPRYLVKSLPLCRAAIFIQRPRIFGQDRGSLANLAVSIGSCAKAYFEKTVMIFAHCCAKILVSMGSHGPHPRARHFQRPRIFPKICVSIRNCDLLPQVNVFCRRLFSILFAKIFVFCPQSFLTISAANIPQVTHPSKLGSF